MAKTLAEFLTYVKMDFKRDDKDTEITQAYNDTIRHLSGMKGLEGRKFTSYITTRIGQEDYALPAGIIHLFRPIRIIEAANLESGGVLNELSRAEWTERYINPNNSDVSAISKAMPAECCIYERSIHVGPVPDKSTYVIEIDWAKISTEQAATTDIQELGEEWEEVEKWGTLFRLYAGLGLDDESSKWLNFYTSEQMGYPYLLKQEKDRTEKMECVKYRDL